MFALAVRKTCLVIGAAISCTSCSDPTSPVMVDAMIGDARDDAVALTDAMTPDGMIAIARTGTCTPTDDTVECAGVFAPQTHSQWPVTCVSWEQADAFCRAAGKRLPTEAEWELAARGTDRRTYPWGETFPTCALVNYHGANGCSGTLDDVGSHPTGNSPFGLVDVSGNAHEWIADRYAAEYYASSPATDPQGPSTDLAHVVRGGSATSTLAGEIRVAHRSIGGAREFEGFRCAKSAN